ncbi:MAG: hypothetical protein IJO52_07395 [Clostridia bacterium]|nr:hypothetical protein [Clostridia bacterium]
MKKNYVAPTVDLYEYSVEDTLLTSGVKYGMLSLFQVEGEAEASVAADWLD